MVHAVKTRAMGSVAAFGRVPGRGKHEGLPMSETSVIRTKDVTSFSFAVTFGVIKTIAVRTKVAVRPSPELLAPRRTKPDAQFPAPSRRSFSALAASDPDRLLEWIDSGDLAATDLTFAAEIAGEIATEEARDVLLRLLDHPDPMVREGAVYGLARHQPNAAVVAALTNLASNDLSKGVRAAATDVLE